MTAEAAPESDGDSVVKTAPRSLPDYLKSKGAAASLYLGALDRRETQLPDEAEREATAELIAADNKLLVKVAELVRASIDRKHEPWVRKQMLSWGAEVLRSRRPDLANWGQVASANPDVELGQLAIHLRKARQEKDKVTVSEAELLIVIGMSVLSERADFDVLGALSALYSGLNPTKTDVAAAQKRAKKALVRASPKLLESFALISKLSSIALEAVRAQFTAASTAVLDIRDRYNVARVTIDNQALEMAALQAQTAQLVTELTAARAQIAGVKGGAAHDMIEVRARFRQFLVRKLSPLVNDASEALNIDPPFPDVTKQRLDLVKNELEKELQWLSQFSD